ncbi:hypothetical protein PRIPAC_89809 [Pristionchus pacificus]|uniref:Uncharacterized protein n=1 Tax=Pristionchus pacificus TaxID=54126 RepID=A0A2A6CVU7_PRIPA|nr:hypothetical protein PRIPAC_89809 [Pristionchus pacificus]|eukprot:PDM82289.1 hypothetical protein PRIPAC_36682 [Pristionchus pacificus]
MMNEKNDYFRFPLALCPSEKSLTSTFGTWEAHGRLRPIASALKGRGRPKKTVSSNAPNSKTRKRSIAEHTGDDVIDGAFTIDDVPIAERDVAGELAGATKIERAEVVLLEGT